MRDATGGKIDIYEGKGIGFQINQTENFWKQEIRKRGRDKK